MKASKVKHQTKAKSSKAGGKAKSDQKSGQSKSAAKVIPRPSMWFDVLKWLTCSYQSS
jgi:hypothetical protein